MLTGVIMYDDCLYDQSLMSAGGDSSQDEAEDDVKAITVKICAHKLKISLNLCANLNPSFLKLSIYSSGEVCSS